MADWLRFLRPKPGRLDRLPGAPSHIEGPVPAVVQAAEDYAKARGIDLKRQGSYVEASPRRGKYIADEYDKMAHAPDDPKVKQSYEAMAAETMAQWQALQNAGIKIDFMKPGMPDPYPKGPREALADLRANGHLWVFPTEQGFGSNAGFDPTSSPLLRDTGIVHGDHPMVVNDAFRAVHDVFGHGMEGANFGARGEENAWNAHKRLYSPEALGAVTSETRGQNSWVNFGPKGAANRANQKNTVFADQKTGLLPDWATREGGMPMKYRAQQAATVGALGGAALLAGDTAPDKPTRTAEEVAAEAAGESYDPKTDTRPAPPAEPPMGGNFIDYMTAKRDRQALPPTSGPVVENPPQSYARNIGRSVQGGAEWLGASPLTADKVGQWAQSAAGWLPGVGTADALQAGDVEGAAMNQAGGAITKSMLIGPASKLWNPRLAALAEKMHGEGKSLDEIWKATGEGPVMGTTRGADTFWKQEVPDEFSWLKAGPLRGDPAEPQTFGDRLKHDYLFDAYPDLAALSVRGEDLAPKERGRFYAPAYGNEGEITVNQAMTPKDQHSSLLHEGTHAVQEMEGWGHGSSPGNFDRGPMFDKRATDLKDDLSRSLFGGLSGNPQEIIGSLSYGDPAELAGIAQKHGFASIDDAKAFLAKQDEMRTPMSQYKRTASEAEARNVQRRADWSPDTLRETPFHQTYDVPLDEQIVPTGRGKLSKENDLFADILAKAKDRTAMATQLAAAGKPVRLQHADGRYALASPDMSAPGGFRLTRFDADGPVGHTEHKTLDEAVNEGLREHYTPQQQRVSKDIEMPGDDLVARPPQEKSGVFDYSVKYPPRDLGIERHQPPKGVPARTRELLANPDVYEGMVKGVERGKPVADWYETSPLRHAFENEFGPEGLPRFDQFIDAVSATSPRSTAGENVRNASYYYGLAQPQEGRNSLPEFSEVPAKQPYPYGHFAQRLHRQNVGNVVFPGGAGYPANNPKPATFAANLKGDPSVVTVDTHAYRAPPMLAGDERFLETSYKVNKDSPPRNFLAELKAGRSMADLQQQGAAWQSAPRPNEYGAFEDYYRRLGQDTGLSPAEAQAASWVGQGQRTGLASAPKSFMDFVEERILKTARERNMDPRDVLANMLRGKQPLLTLPATLAAGTALLDRRQGDEQ